MLYTTPSGLKFDLRDDNPMADKSIIYDVVEQDEYDLAKLQISKPSIIVDLGSHIGAFTIMVKKLWPDVRVIAVEPNPSSYRACLQNIDLNGFKNITVINAAISNLPKVNLYAKSEQSTISMTTAPGNEPDLSIVPGGFGHLVETKEIRGLRFDAILNREGIMKVDLLKMDIEGAEVEMLKTMSKDTAAGIQNIVGEYHVSGGWKAFEPILKELFPNTHISNNHRSTNYGSFVMRR